MTADCRDNAAFADIRVRLAVSALQFVQATPDEEGCLRVFSPADAKRVSAFRAAALNFAVASRWTESEAKIHLDAFAAAQSVMGSSMDTARAANQPGLTDCANGCSARTLSCYRSCRDISCMTRCYSDFWDCLKGCVISAIRDIFAFRQAGRSEGQRQGDEPSPLADKTSSAKQKKKKKEP